MKSRMKRQTDGDGVATRRPRVCTRRCVQFSAQYAHKAFRRVWQETLPKCPTYRFHRCPCACVRPTITVICRENLVLCFYVVQFGNGEREKSDIRILQLCSFEFRRSSSARPYRKRKAHEKNINSLLTYRPRIWYNTHIFERGKAFRQYQLKEIGVNEYGQNDCL